MTSTQRNPQPGLIYEYTYTGESYFRATLNADLTVTMVNAQTCRTVEVGVLSSLGTLEMWAKWCFETANGQETYCTLGPVGLRMARKYAEKCGALGRTRAAAFHRQLAGRGVPGTEHYAVCARVLGRGVQSLATLTEDEARKVWASVQSGEVHKPAHAA
ncbi:hypothetical protein HNQ07_004227 [Deinococcus metalli]|uniref:Uncharacterized protein n=1 Tax=Deinococcus metalli TaxID=1141878 RepID=A0A7W8KIV7_9DEIO|nr:hypothetical protein [Deinococcus metalli]MBB5378720.1 hypothetical protein [Deinococcus metalli]GHF60435.1 hypothetical protein GCM10017781_40780 [Deinococcus metalli]